MASQTDWNNNSCTNTLISASTTAPIPIDGSLDYQFNAIPPTYATTSLYLLHANLTGTEESTLAVDSHFNGAISVVGDAYASENIITSNNITITSGTGSPTTTDIGSGSSQTFLTTDLRRIRVHLDYISGGGSIQVQYNDNDTNPTRLVTPTVDWGEPAGNNDPTISNLQIHNAVDITLVEYAQGAGTYNASTTFRVTDIDGLSEIATTTIFVYRSGVGLGSCDTEGELDINNCYPSTSSADSAWSPGAAGGGDDGIICARTATGADWADFWCTTTLYYVAEATDAASAGYDYSGQTWTVYASTSDINWAQGNATDSTVEVNTNQALGIDPTSIQYGNIITGANTGSKWATTTASTTGNVVIDVHFSGTNMTGTGDDIVASQQEFTTTSPAVYGTSNISLTTGGETHDLTMAKATTTIPGPTTAAEIYWGIAIPSLQISGSYTGTNTFTATSTIVTP